MYIKNGHWADPFDQIRSRITHRIDLANIGKAAFVRPDDVRKIAADKFDLKLDAAAARELCELARLDGEGSVRLVENTLKHARRLVKAGRLGKATGDIIGKAMDRSLSKRTRDRVRTTQAPTPQAATPPAAGDTREAIRATA